MVKGITKRTSIQGKIVCHSVMALIQFYRTKPFWSISVSISLLNSFAIRKLNLWTIIWTLRSLVFRSSQFSEMFWDNGQCLISFWPSYEENEEYELKLADLGSVQVDSIKFRRVAFVCGIRTGNSTPLSSLNYIS